jgi:hypothetical protein
VNRLIASLAMGSVMAVVMLGYVRWMYEGQGIKIGVLAGAALLGMAFLYVNRSHILIENMRFMKAMIPHHSIAVNNARKAHFRDPRVRELADEIIASQVREIREMKLLIDDIEQNGRRGDTTLPAHPPVVTPDMLPKIREAAQ